MSDLKLLKFVTVSTFPNRGGGAHRRIGHSQSTSLIRDQMTIDSQLLNSLCNQISRSGYNDGNPRVEGTRNDFSCFYFFSRWEPEYNVGFVEERGLSLCTDKYGLHGRGWSSSRSLVCLRGAGTEWRWWWYPPTECWRHGQFFVAVHLDLWHQWIPLRWCSNYLVRQATLRVECCRSRHSLALIVQFSKGTVYDDFCCASCRSFPRINWRIFMLPPN